MALKQSESIEKAERGVDDQTPSSAPMRPYGSYRRLLAFVAPYKLTLLVSLLGFALYATMEALLIRSVEFFVDQLAQPDLYPVWAIPAAIVLLSLFRGLGFYVGNFSLSRAGLNVINDLRIRLFNHLLYLPRASFDRINTGEHVSLITYNIQQVTGSVTDAFKTVIRDGFSVIGFLLLLLYYNWKLTLVFFAVAPILAALVWLASRYFRKVSHRLQKAFGQITHVATEVFQSINLVKSYRGEPREKQRFKQASEKTLGFGLKFERVASLQTPVLHFVIAIDLAVIFLLVLLFWDGTAGEAVAYVGAAAAIAKPFRSLSSVNTIIQKGLAAADTIFEVLDSETEVDSGHKQLTDCRGDVSFTGVNFAYTEEAEAPLFDGQDEGLALKQFDFTLKAGETLALVGASGSGKTTITNLLLGFYRPQSGSIRIDGIDIRELTLASLRNSIAIVDQHTRLFAASVADNIAYGDFAHSEDGASDATYKDRARVEKALLDSQSADFVNKLPNGMDTVLQEGGNQLSGGQRQRLAIARALYKNAPILILDEATSALDTQSERLIQQAIDTASQDRTTIVIAHRLSTIVNADRILVMDNGELVESGTHEELLAKQGAYARLHGKARASEQEREQERELEEKETEDELSTGIKK